MILYHYYILWRKRMISVFKPTWMVSSVYSIAPEQLKKQGIKAVFTDLDNTLIAWNNPDGTPELWEWMNALKQAGIPLIVISNNSYKRVKHAVAPLDLPFTSRALKPLGFGIKRAMHRINLTEDEIVMVGDQLITDVVAANRAHVRSILVKPLIESDAWNTRPNRFFEIFIKKQLAHKYPTLRWQEGLND
ncbi:hydrolase [Paucilactobacillus suebicus DSM 5007 = KCTC 3549]|uniref:Hydrolase n=2 Tax=Paucilactobacillus suebicus TaxID=152335 RepID=A0A0R1W737_9LACO|nr:hydrolase [Paucilactobacillus suebicus DSM 5007 = KCTC 3549]